MQHFSTATIPRGSVAVDRNGDYLVAWPDGRYGHDIGHTHVAPSSSTGPYEVVLRGLDDVDCDALADVPTDPPTRRALILAALRSVAALLAGADDGIEIRPGSIAKLVQAKTTVAASPDGLTYGPRTGVRGGRCQKVGA